MKISKRSKWAYGITGLLIAMFVFMVGFMGFLALGGSVNGDSMSLLFNLGVPLIAIGFIISLIFAFKDDNMLFTIIFGIVSVIVTGFIIFSVFF